MSDAPHTPKQRLLYAVIGVILITVSVGLLTWCVLWFYGGHYEYVLFNGMVGLALGIIGVDYLIDAFS